MYVFILQFQFFFPLIHLQIAIDYSPPLSYIFIHGWQAFASCFITWAQYLVFLLLIISLCNVDEEIVKDVPSPEA